MHAWTSRRGRGVILSSIAALLVSAALPAAAATFYVDSTADAPDANTADGICADSQGRCTLRAAVMQANATGGANTIDLSLINDPTNPIILSIPGVDETVSGSPGQGYVVTSGQDASKGDLNITSSVTIVGAGSDKTIIEWDPSVKSAPDNGDRVFHVEAGSSSIDVSISGVTIENGVTGPPVVLQTLSDGTYYQFERWGGGIAIGPSAAVTLIDPSVSGSESGSGSDEGGGGSGGSEEGESSAVVNSVVMSDVRVLDNQSGAAGGGISNAAPLTLNGVLVSGNVAATNGGGIYNDAQLTVNDSTIGTMTGFANPNTAEGGGGLFDTGMHTTAINASSIVGNTATGGGGISARSLVTLNITNTTIAKNASTDVGGGITTNGPVNLKNDTIADNTSANDSTGGGAGLNGFGSAVYSYVNTAFQHNVVSASSASANCGCSGPSCKAGTLVSLGHNIADDTSCALSAAGDIPSTNAQLQGLAGNGGRTETMGLLMNTPAVDAGDNANCPNTDQRGNMRPADGNLHGNMACDIGAYELFTPSNDLHVSGKNGKGQVRRGDPAEASFDFTNDQNASADATGVTITTAPLPTGYALSSATLTITDSSGNRGTPTACAFDASTRVVSCDVGTLPRGQTATLDLQGTGTALGSIALTATIAATAPADIFPDNNTTTVTILVQGNSNLAITATGPSQSPTVNGSAAINFTVKNLGPDPANNVQILARFQNRMRYQNLKLSNSGTCTLGQDQANASCNLGSIGSGESVTGTLNLTPTATGDATIDLQTTTDDYDTDNTNNAVTVPLTVAAEPTPPPVTPTTSSSSGGGCVARPGAPFDPMLVSLALLGAAGIGVRRWRRTAEEGSR